MIFRTKALRVFCALFTFMFVLSSCVLTVLEPASASFWQADLHFTTPSITVTEGRPVTLTAQLSRGTGFGATSHYSTSDGTATAGSDYDAANSVMLYWPPWATNTTLTINTVDDSTYEGDETFTVYLHDPTTSADINSPSEVTVTIKDNDNPPPTISLASSTFTGSEASGSAVITVNKNGTGAATIDYSITGGTAAAGSDYTDNSGTLSFGAAETSKAITVSVTDDADVETAETFNVSLGNPVNSTLGSPSSGVVTITDNDVAASDPGSGSGTGSGSGGGSSTPLLTLGSTSYSATENAGSLTVTINKSTDGAASVVLNTSGSAYTNAAYSVQTTTVSLGAADTSKDVTVYIKDDTTVDGSESTVITLTNPSGASLGYQSSAMLTITDNDTSSSGSGSTGGSTSGGSTAGGSTIPVIQFASSTYSVAENGGSVAVVVNKSAAGVATVVLTTSGSAYTNSACSSQTSTLSLSSADTSQNVTLYIKDDTIVDSSESATITLSSPNGATLGSQSSTILTIADNEAADDKPLIRFSTTSKTVDESVGRLIITITKTAIGTATVDYNVTGTANHTSGIDYNGPISGTVSFAATETSKTLTELWVQDDLEVESTETLIVKLSNPTGASLGSPAEITISIADNDNHPVIEFSSASYSASENNTAAISISVKRTGLTTGTSSVKYSTTDGTAKSGSDYTGANSILNFAAGETEKSFTVRMIDDTALEGAETFTLKLSDFTDAISGPNATATFYINDNEGSAKMQFSNALYTCVENVGNFAVTVTRTGDTSTPTEISYATSSGTATPGTDYQAASGKLVFAVGETSKTFTVPIIDDVINGEILETVILQLSSSDAALLGLPVKAVLSIVDNDTVVINAANEAAINNALAQAANAVNGGAAQITAAVTTAKKPNSPVAVNVNNTKKYVSSLNVPEDILGHWGRDSIMNVMDKGAIAGYADFTMKPNRPITRAEAAVIIATALKLTDYTPTTKTGAYRDALPSWAKNAILTLTEKKLMGGYADGRFMANKPITRAEICTILMKAFPKSAVQSPDLAFADKSRIPSWAQQFVAQALSSGVVGGYPDKTFKPSRKVTRAETCVMLCNAAGYK